MTAVLLTLAALAAFCWVCASPVRLAAAGGVLLVSHPVQTFALTAVAAVALTVAAVVFTVRTVRAEGWHLVTVQRPNLAPVPAGGVTV
ncbi:hypothetical protein SAMN04489713_11668 [Actinomadura madurae]|uniref:Uncharacterized protein n=1 Tax=Actinomadura madurae TaxID=1993 RepID=A0A1I5S7V3_9ACTN|nr:hypothetical protein [Actinomadura madurae]SFP66804.1 hypothetical protein SAMN04489713_11668 [Actinomadura madurae]